MSVGTAIGFGRRAFRGEAAIGCSVEGSLKRSFHRGVLQLVLFAIFLVSGVTSLLIFLVISMNLTEAWEEETSISVFRLVDFIFRQVVPISIAGICCACVGMLNRVERKATLKFASGGLAVAVAGIFVLDQIQSWIPRDTIDTEAEARPILERLVKGHAKSYPDTMRVVDLKQQIRNITINGPAMTFEEDWTRYIEFDLDGGCGEVASMMVYIGSDGPIDLSGKLKTKCRPEPNQAG